MFVLQEKMLIKEIEKEGGSVCEKKNKIEKLLFSNPDLLAFTQEYPLQHIPDYDTFLEQTRQWLLEFEYEPTEDEIPYWPEMYEPAIGVIKQMSNVQLPSEKLRVFKKGFGLALRAYQMSRIAFDEQAYCEQKPQFDDYEYADMDNGNYDFEELPPET